MATTSLQGFSIVSDTELEKLRTLPRFILLNDSYAYSDSDQYYDPKFPPTESIKRIRNLNERTIERCTAHLDGRLVSDVQGHLDAIANAKEMVSICNIALAHRRLLEWLATNL